MCQLKLKFFHIIDANVVRTLLLRDASNLVVDRVQVGAVLFGGHSPGAVIKSVVLRCSSLNGLTSAVVSAR